MYLYCKTFFIRVDRLICAMDKHASLFHQCAGIAENKKIAQSVRGRITKLLTMALDSRS
jgi:hypothetical protein